MNFQINTSCIIITDDFDTLKEQVINQFGLKNIRFFEKDKLLIDDSGEIIRNAYIAEATKTIFFISANSYEVLAQNKLLKLLEDGMQNIIFILVAKSKSIFLPTIKSRLMIYQIPKTKELMEVEIDLKSLDLQKIYEFIEQNKFLSASESKNLIQSIMMQAIKANINFSYEELDKIQNLVKAANFNAKSHIVLLNLLLIILYRKYR